MTEPHDPGKDAEAVTEVKKGIEPKLAEIKEDLAAWIDEHTPPADSCLVSIALLELAVKRFVEHGEEGVVELIKRSFANVSASTRTRLQ
jgi:hypothetical protein